MLCLKGLFIIYCLVWVEGRGLKFWVLTSNSPIPPPIVWSGNTSPRYLSVPFKLSYHTKCQVSVPKIEYQLGGSSNKISHVYFLLIVAMVLLLWHQIVLLWHQVTMVASKQHLYQTIEQFDKTIVLPRKLATGSIHNYNLCYCPLMGILFEVLRIWVLSWIVQNFAAIS